jgi:hypothetical protein
MIRLMGSLGLMIVLGLEPSLAEDLQLMLPGMNVSSRPIVEFRARRGNADNPPASLGGHAYVLLGRELDNGNIIYNTVAGFYPKDDKASGFKKFFGTTGVVKQELDDNKSEITFRVNITPTQEVAVAKVIASYDEKNYSVLFSNCKHMVKDVANVLRLSVPDLKDAFPADLISELKNSNLPDTPLAQSRAAKQSPNQAAPPGPAPRPDSLAPGLKIIELNRAAMPPSTTPTVPAFDRTQVPNFLPPLPPPPPPPPVILSPPPSVSVAPQR